MALPTQFRIFRKGVNTSTKGTVVFDDKAAAAVMADYNRHGADLMMDLEHLSVAKDSPNYNPNAMAWFKLTLRNGELWATDVRYTPEGAKRLTEKSQRYISPLFMVEKATKRVVQIINSALTALPASDKPMALVAASQNTAVMAFSIVGNPMDLSALIQLLGLPSDATLDDIVAAVKALQEGKEPAATEPPAAPAAPAANSEGAGLGGATSTPVNESATPRKTTVSIQHSQDAGSAAVIELTRKVASLEAAAFNRTRDDLIRANAGKLTPTLEAWARTQSIETLTSYFAVATPTTGSAEEEPDREAVQHSQSPKGKTAVVALTAAEIEVCQKTGVSQEKALAYKQSQANMKGNG